VVLARQARGDSALYVQAMGGEAAAELTEGGSVLQEQGAVRAACNGAGLRTLSRRGSRSRRPAAGVGREG
jgi:hypothetical protein